jgi:hypothetical protein
MEEKSAAFLCNFRARSVFAFSHVRPHPPALLGEPPYLWSIPKQKAARL